MRLAPVRDHQHHHLRSLISGMLVLPVLPVMVVLISSALEGRWSGELLGVPSGTLGEPTAHAPLLGNG